MSFLRKQESELSAIGIDSRLRENDIKNMRTYYVYILTNHTKTTLYIGVTGNLEGRILQHREGQIEGFTKKYHVKYLVHYEEFNDVYQAITREKNLKKWKRAWKEQLINEFNPEWKDLSKEWF